MARVLITGGAGYVGSHCAQALHAAGHECVVFDNLSSGHRDFVRWGAIAEGDIRNAAAVEAALGRTFDAVLHFAGLSSVAESMAVPELYIDNNVRGTRVLLEVMQRAKVKRFVFSSSCAIYGIPASVPIGEDADPQPISVYGETKLECERMIGEFASRGSLAFVNLRYFNAAGADPSGNIGEDHERETRLIPLALDAASGRKPYLSLFGTEYDTPDRTAIRDYVHVCDLAAAHVAALDHLIGGGKSISLNLGTERGYSVREVLDEIEIVTGLPVPVQIREARPGDPPVLVADSRKAQTVLNWQPCHSSLRRIIADAWLWHGNRFAPDMPHVRTAMR